LEFVQKKKKGRRGGEDTILKKKARKKVFPVRIGSHRERKGGGHGDYWQPRKPREERGPGWYGFAFPGGKK